MEQSSENYGWRVAELIGLDFGDFIQMGILSEELE